MRTSICFRQGTSWSVSMSERCRQCRVTTCTYTCMYGCACVRVSVCVCARAREGVCVCVCHVEPLPPVPGHHIFLEQIQALLARGLVASQRRRRQRQGVLLDPLVELVANHLRVCVWV